MNKRIYEAIILAVALIIFGLIIRSGLVKSRESERTVSVKGLSERLVPANKVTWPLVYKELGNDLPSLYNTIQDKNAKIISFLKAHGIADEEISVNPPRIIDVEANNIYGGSEVIKYKYNVTSVIIVTSTKVDAVRELIVQQSSLLKDGIALIMDDYNYNVIYEFTALNDIKPEMIEEATANAREAAEKFAEDSKSKLGKIRYARQGQFSITDRDVNTPYLKVVRVVTSVDYSLNN